MAFDTREQAVLANEAVRTVLEPTKNSSIPAEEIELNLKLAKEVSREAASKAADTTVAVMNTSVPSYATPIKNSLPIQTNIDATSVAATVVTIGSSSASVAVVTPSPTTPLSDKKSARDALVGEEGRLLSNELSSQASVDGRREEEIVDIVSELRFKVGDCIEVKYFINDDDNSEGEGQKENTVNEKRNVAMVWWPATLTRRTDRMHRLTEEERKEGESDNLHSSSVAKLPIYLLNYSPLEGEMI